ncbi:MAG: penicillin-binding protein 2 [Actinomycetia bacterium]|nr:penicillin-binding protein 2 [Actinomycetes bacterium]
MILEPGKERRPSGDDSFLGIRVGVLLLIAFFLFGVLGFRLWYLQILSGDRYVESATVNRVRTVVVEAPRGVIYDCNGEVLVDNRAGLSVGMLPMDMYDPKDEPEEFQAEIARLAQLLGTSEADLLKDYERAKRDPYITYAVEEDVPEETVVAYLKEHAQDFPGIEVEKTYLRQYPYKALATHLLGFVGEISEADLDQEEFTDLTAGVHVGKDGVERTYDSYLRGTDGWKTVEVDARGRPVEFVEDVAAESGYNLILTIDAELQQAAEKAIVEGIQRAHVDGYTNAAGGAVVALDPRTGEVLAMASYPDYDPSLWVGGIEADKYAELLEPEANSPLFNRAVNGLYPAGSTFKPFVATAALDAGVVTWDTIINCNGRYSVAGQTWKDWTEYGHGDVNLVAAIAQSCDVYFYNLGYLLWEQAGQPLQEGLRRFGFGDRTGIDLPGETTGSRVPDKIWKRETGQTDEEQAWKPGDEINLAIGQGDLLVTPLQLAVGLSAIVNGGDVWVPHLALQITDSSGRIIHQFTDEKDGELGVAADILNKVRRGLRLVTSDPSGTAYDAFRGFPRAVGGKTGTAQKAPDDDYALFMGYAPADGNGDPEIVVVALIEEGGHGSSVAAPVVRRVMEAYFGYEPGGSEIVPVTE